MSLLKTILKFKIHVKFCWMEHTSLLEAWLIKIKERKILVEFYHLWQKCFIPAKVLKVNIENFERKPIERLNSTLSFNFKEGACGTYRNKEDKEFALLCFDRKDGKFCYTCTKEQLETDQKCEKIEAVPTKKSRRNAIRLGNFKGWLDNNLL